jgi:hypothetical protein
MGDEVEIPIGWLQRMSKREFISFILACVGAGVWGYSTNQTVLALQNQLTQTRAELTAYVKEQDKKNETSGRVLAVLEERFSSIDDRLKSIEVNVRRMAQ